MTALQGIVRLHEIMRYRYSTYITGPLIIILFLLLVTVQSMSIGDSASQNVKERCQLQTVSTTLPGTVRSWTQLGVMECMVWCRIKQDFATLMTHLKSLEGVSAMVCILCWDKKSFFRIMRTYQDTSQETHHTCCTALIFTSMKKLIFVLKIYNV